MLQNSVLQVKKCGDSFKKSCTLEYDRVPRRIRTRVCRDAVTTVCSKEEEGKEEEEEEEICSVVYETGWHFPFIRSMQPACYALVLRYCVF